MRYVLKKISRPKKRYPEFMHIIATINATRRKCIFAGYHFRSIRDKY